jgi:hypothetical protein
VKFVAAPLFCSSQSPFFSLSRCSGQLCVRLPLFEFAGGCCFYLVKGSELVCVSALYYYYYFFLMVIAIPRSVGLNNAGGVETGRQCIAAICVFISLSLYSGVFLSLDFCFYVR